MLNKKIGDNKKQEQIASRDNDFEIIMLCIPTLKRQRK